MTYFPLRQTTCFFIPLVAPCKPLLSKEQYERREARCFVKSKFRGSLKDFLVAFSGSDSLDDKDIKDLKEWLHEFDD